MIIAGLVQSRFQGRAACLGDGAMPPVRAATAFARARDAATPRIIGKSRRSYKFIFYPDEYGHAAAAPPR
jgi:hypothetical protein